MLQYIICILFKCVDEKKVVMSSSPHWWNVIIKIQNVYLNKWWRKWTAECKINTQAKSVSWPVYYYNNNIHCEESPVGYVLVAVFMIRLQFWLDLVRAAMQHFLFSIWPVFLRAMRNNCVVLVCAWWRWWVQCPIFVLDGSHRLIACMKHNDLLYRWFEILFFTYPWVF